MKTNVLIGLMAKQIPPQGVTRFMMSSNFYCFDEFHVIYKNNQFNQHYNDQWNWTIYFQTSLEIIWIFTYSLFQ